MVLLVCFLGLLGGYAQAIDGSALEDFKIGGINPIDILKAMEEISCDTNKSYEHKQNVIDLARLDLEKRKINISDEDYNDEKTKLTHQQQVLDEDKRDAKKFGQKVSDIGLDIAKATFQGLIDTRKIEAEGEARLGMTLAAEDGKTERLQIFLQKENLIKLCLTFGGSVGIWYTGRFAYKYFDAKLGMPTLIRPANCSRASVLHYLSWKKKPTKQEEAFAPIILSHELQQTVVSLAKATAVTHEKGLQYRHLLLYGPPGTGKTLIAQTLARSSGMDFAMMSGADFSQFKSGDDVKELHKVFDWAEYGKRGLILFIDEADAFLSDRSKECDERRLNLVNAFLSRTNSSSEKIMIILASNYAENLDAAVLSRINKKVEIPLPGLTERVKLLQLYIDTHLKQPQKHTRILTIDGQINDQYVKEVAQKIDGFSGRSIDQLIAEVGIEGFISGDDMVTKEIFDSVIADKIQQYQKERAWEASTIASMPIA